MSLARLFAENAVLALLGLGLLPVIGVASTPARLRELWGLAYLAGIAAAGIVSAALASIPVSFPPVALLALAVVTLVGGLVRIGLGEPRPPKADSQLVDRLASFVLAPSLIAGGVAALAIVAQKPLREWDGWAIWGLKARAIASLGSSSGEVLASSAYYFSHPEYPLLLPALDALGIRSAGGYESRLVVMQSVLVGVAGLLAIWALLRDRVRPAVLWPALAAIATAPAVLAQLASGYADFPTAFFVAAGLLAGARWLLEARWPWLGLTSLFLSAAALTKDEGGLFAAAVFIALLATARDRRLHVLGATVLAVCGLLPWRIFIAVHHFTTSDFSLSRSFEPTWVSEHAGNAPRALHALIRMSVEPRQFGLLVPLAVAGLVAALVVRSYRLAAYTVTFAVLSMAGLAWIYVVSSIPLDFYLGQTTHRITASVVLGCAALAPLVASERPERADGLVTVSAG